MLAVNAAKDATELIARLRAYHYNAQTRPDKKGLSAYGLDLEAGAIRNNVEAGVLEPALAKTKIIQARAHPIRRDARPGRPILNLQGLRSAEGRQNGLS